MILQRMPLVVTDLKEVTSLHKTREELKSHNQAHIKLAHSHLQKITELELQVEANTAELNGLRA